jgi:hypothetical protein
VSGLGFGNQLNNGGFLTKVISNELIDDIGLDEIINFFTVEDIGMFSLLNLNYFC